MQQADSARKVPLTADVKDILPIIKRFMYSEREVFIRELASNAIDALQKLEQLARTGKASLDDGEPLRVEITVDPARGTITIEDNGIGMSSEEIVRYVNQIAFSGAKEFLNQHKDAETELIGQFGLGFYSSFMVSKLVEIITRSWRSEAGGCHWSCDGGPITRIDEKNPRPSRGTSVICHLEDNMREFLDPQRIEQVIRRFLDYAPYPIFLAGRQVNVVTAPWHLSPAEREGMPNERYGAFYERLNPDENRPLAWFHVESDFPIQVKALLFIPDRAPSAKGNLRMFATRTFITDHCTELLTDWLDFLDGVIDSPDLPLNVARDRFQQDRKVVTLRNHLATRTLGFLAEMLVKRRRDYTAFWECYGSRLKQGYVNCVMDEQKSFSEKIEKLLVFPSSRKPLTTIAEYLERASESAKPSILYMTDPHAQRAHLELMQSRNREVLFFTDPIDVVLVRILSEVHSKYSFIRIDQIGADESAKPVKPAAEASTGVKEPQAAEEIKDKKEETDWEPLSELFREIAGERINKVSIEALPSRDLPAILRVTDAGAKQDDLSRLMGGEAKHKWHLVINSNCPLIKTMARIGPGVRATAIPMGMVGQIWDNIRISSGLLKGDELMDAARRNHDFLTQLANHLF
ncbi:molecular chaperone HtpG [candidate division KSB1 bacterium]|nr:molecular chaperone HtpG [candidate division KSB1 bacterium]